MYIDLNAATTEELERLPSIGEKMAMRIVEYSAREWPFPNGSTTAAGQRYWGRYLEKVAPFLQVK